MSNATPGAASPPAVDAAALLNTVPLFAALPARHLKGLGQACVERAYTAGSRIVEQGNPGVGLFVIVSGRVRVVKRIDADRQIDVAEHGAGEVIGEMSVLDGAPRSADVFAVEDTTCLVLPSWAFKSFMETHPEVALHILPIVIARFRETNQTLLSLKLSS